MNIYPDGRATKLHTDQVQNNTKKCAMDRVLEKIGGGFFYLKHDRLGVIVVWIPNGVALLMLPEAMSTLHRAERLERLPLTNVPTHLTCINDESRRSIVTDFAVRNWEHIMAVPKHKGFIEHTGLLEVIRSYFNKEDVRSYYVPGSQIMIECIHIYI